MYVQNISVETSTKICGNGTDPLVFSDLSGLNIGSEALISVDCSQYISVLDDGVRYTS